MAADAELMNQIKQFFAQRDRFARNCGVEVVAIKPGWAQCRMAVTPEHYNGVNTVQGGALFTLADLAFAAACNSHGTVAVAININMTFMKAVTQGTLMAEAVEEVKNPRLSACHVKITDDAGDIVATFSGLAYRKKDSLAEIVAAG